MAIVKVGWSGGKDSSCAVMEHIKRGDKVIAVCYVPMFTDKIPLILKKHYEFILKTADFFRRLGATVHIVSGMTYVEYVTHRAKKGKFKGQIFGFPCFQKGKCGFKRDSKIKACAELDVGHYDYESLGIASDETDRHNQLNDSKRSILVELDITESEASKRCDLFTILSPHYNDLSRDGCVLCPNASEKERQLWYKDYPEAVSILLALQDFVKKERSDRFPLRNYQWFL